MAPIQTVPVATKRKGRTSSTFTPEQEAVYQSKTYIDEFEALVRRVDPMLKQSDNKEVAAWKTATANTVLDHELFSEFTLLEPQVPGVKQKTSREVAHKVYFSALSMIDAR